jgi:hypothetical protein
MAGITVSVSIRSSIVRVGPSWGEKPRQSEKWRRADGKSPRRYASRASAYLARNSCFSAEIWPARPTISKMACGTSIPGSPTVSISRNSKFGRMTAAVLPQTRFVVPSPDPAEPIGGFLISAGAIAQSSQKPAVFETNRRTASRLSFDKERF